MADAVFSAIFLILAIVLLVKWWPAVVKAIRDTTEDIVYYLLVQLAHRKFYFCVLFLIAVVYASMITLFTGVSPFEKEFAYRNDGEHILITNATSLQESQYYEQLQQSVPEDAEDVRYETNDYGNGLIVVSVLYRFPIGYQYSPAYSIGLIIFLWLFMMVWLLPDFESRK